MKVVDANILLYAVDRDSVHHAPIRLWWERTVNGDEPVGLCWIVLLAFMRMSTNSRVFGRPLTPEQASATVDGWLAQPNVRTIAEKDGHWNVFRRLLEEAGTGGNLVTDAHLAAVAITHGAVLSSCDNDFGRFRGLRWENPLDTGQE